MSAADKPQPSPRSLSEILHDPAGFQLEELLAAIGALVQKQPAAR